MKLGAPRLLSSRVTLSNGLVGSIPFDIQTPNHEALLVSELRIHAITGSGRKGISKFGNYSDVGGFIYVKIRLGPYAFSSQAIPVWALAASRDFTHEGADWRVPLAKPMFIPPGMSLFAEASRPGVSFGGVTGFEPEPLAGGGFDVVLTAVARAVTADFPRTTAVPYVSAYVEADPVVGGRGFRSGQQTLDNQLKNAIDLRYALGRVTGLETGVIAANNESHEIADVRLSMPCSLLYGNQVIINSGSEFNVSFDPCTRVLNLGSQVLPAGDRLTFKADAPTYAPNQNIDAFMVVLGIIGDRKEAV